MMTEGRLNKVLNLKSNKKKKNNAKPQSRIREAEPIKYNGQDRIKHEVQTELDGLSNSDRVVSLTADTQKQVVEKLKELGATDFETGASVYAEWREAINDSLDDPMGDRIESYWVHSLYLKDLMERKQQVEYYERLRRPNKDK